MKKLVQYLAVLHLAVISATVLMEVHWQRNTWDQDWKRRGGGVLVGKGPRKIVRAM